MKMFILLLCILPMVINANLISNLFDTSELKKFVNDLVGKFGSDATEKQCEQECLVVFTNALLDTACDTMCTGVQQLIQRFHH